MDISSLLAENNINVATTVLYLGDILSKGIASGIGKDLWEKIKGKAKSKSEVEALNKFEEQPNNDTTKGKVEMLLENWIEIDPQFDKDLKSIINNKNSTDNQVKSSINSSKNVVLNSPINLNSGNIHIGDNEK